MLPVTVQRGILRIRSTAAVGTAWAKGRRLAADATNPPTPVLPMRIVERVQGLLPIFGNAGYFALASGFLMTDPLALRTLMVCGYGSLVCYHSGQYRPLRIPLCGSFFFVAVNSYFAGKIINERFVSLSTEEESIYAEHFHEVMSKYDFKQLMAHAEICIPDERTDLVCKGTLASLGLILDGEATVLVGDDVVATLKKGSLTGEISCLHGTNASATVRTTPGCKYILWKRPELLEFLKTKEGTGVKKGIELKMGRELARKLAATTSAIVAEHSHAHKEHHEVRSLEYEDAVLRHLFKMVIRPDCDQSGSSKLFFDEMAAYRAAENVEDDLHSEVMDKMNINEQVAIREDCSVLFLSKGVAIGKMQHVRK